ncbi:Arginine utilization regulatory protein rocR (modular protein) [Desulfamplus magnetovallimortis]|uniref:Arginine utilization regulatory protein rocR (Modular protein) n=1 Tax=Desulfamplus magnetovallimortis TaxID=1246637 RepID=A0A1W1HG58_9BACT|nr:sigma 54-interacting transcriptional regulator [Desulfamplus magnetovallimortis]SLM31464.1 Arginine utilization regulatory protein rocR (modular protein) [Desulfamplus magnetovallimortis]
MVHPDNAKHKEYQNTFNNADFLSVFDKFSEGVILTNVDGLIIYYNTAMSRIDELKPEEVLFKKITDVYHLTEEKSIIMRCLKKRQPIIDEPIYYRTRMGKFANTIHSAFPLSREGILIGAICFIRDYNLLTETIEDMPVPKNIFEDDIFFESIIGNDPELIKAIDSARMAANTPSPVMLYGETGTGKELFARAIHNHSIRSNSKYTPVNCAAIPENLLEGILFGTSKGAFTGALNKAGLFERTNGGTIFLDEINSMPVGLQSKILRVLQERRVRRVGALKEIEINVKIVSSVNTDPYTAINNGTLRSDLFYRLGVVFIHIVPLARRIGDIELLVSHFIAKHNRILGRDVERVSNDILDLFKIYNWPGNVRELEHVIEGAMNIVGNDTVISMKHLQSHFSNWSVNNTAFSGTLGNSPSSRQYRNKTSENIVTRPDRENEFNINTIHPDKPDQKATLPLAPFMDDNNNKDATTREYSANTSITNIQSGVKTKQDLNEYRNNMDIPKNNLFHSRDEQEKKLVHATLSGTNGNIARAAKNLGISRQLLYYKMKKYNLKRVDYI